MEVNWRGVRELIARRAIRGLNSTIRWTEARAKHYAPVRKIFSVNKGHGGRRGPAPSQHPGQLGAGYMHGINQGWNGWDYRAWKNAKARNRRIDTDQGVIYGNPNSAQPVFRLNSVRSGKAQMQTGNFRNFDSATGQLSTSGRAGTFFFQNRGSSRGETSNPVDPMSMLTSRGRYEVRTARARYSQVAVTRSRLDANGNVQVQGRYAGGSKDRAMYRIDPMSGVAHRWARRLGRPVQQELPTRIGGRLREEIFSYEPDVSTIGNLVEGYVVSPTPYAIHQEYGTRHHRSHPYMRPALYEARGRLRRDVASSISRGGAGFSKVGAS